MAGMNRALLLNMKTTLRPIPSALQHTLVSHSRPAHENHATMVVCMGVDPSARMWANVQDVRDRFWGMAQEKHAHCVDGFIL